MSHLNDKYFPMLMERLPSISSDFHCLGYTETVCSQYQIRVYFFLSENFDRFCLGETSSKLIEYPIDLWKNGDVSFERSIEWPTKWMIEYMATQNVIWDENYGWQYPEEADNIISLDDYR